MGKRVCALEGERHVIEQGSDKYPDALRRVSHPPTQLFVLGDPNALQEGLAVVGARKATPYGVSCARTFAAMAAERGIVIISGGARGCDSVAHEAALACGTPTVAFLGGGIDEPYPMSNVPLFQRIVDAGGALVSEHEWGRPPLPYAFRERNRLIAGLARATLIVEAGLPSGTFSTADAALSVGREVMAVPGAITSPNSKGANRLITQGATPVVDEETFEDVLLSTFGALRRPGEVALCASPTGSGIHEGEEGRYATASDALLSAICAEPLGVEALRDLASSYVDARECMTWLMVWLAKAQRCGVIAQYPDGRYGPYVSAR